MPSTSLGPDNPSPFGKLTPQTQAAAALLPHSPQPEPALDSAAQVEQKLRESAQADPKVLRQLIARYDATTNPSEREALRAILGTLDKPEALAFFARLATSSSVAERQEAYALLQYAPNTPQTRSLLRQALTTEQTPSALVQAIAALRPTAVDPVEASAITGQLRSLNQHTDAAVRSSSLLQLAQWDSTGAGQDRYAQALSDPAPQVRQAAIFAIAQSGLRSETLKTGLFGVLSSSSESRELKGSALQALERFALSQEEFAKLSQARAEHGF